MVKTITIILLLTQNRELAITNFELVTRNRVSKLESSRVIIFICYLQDYNVAHIQ